MGSKAVTTVYAGSSPPAVPVPEAAVSAVPPRTVSPGEPSTIRASARACGSRPAGSSRSRATANRSDEVSTPVTAAPREAAISRASPEPQPRPSSRAPDPTSNRS